MPGQTHLPIPPTPFVGRSADLTAVGGLLARADVRLVTLTGAAGVGKTRLAVEVARRAAGDFADGAAFASLAEVRDPATVPSALLQVLGVADVGSRPPVALLADVLAGRDSLLVLDNFEHIIDAADCVATLLQDCPRLKVLATSRRPLGIRAERCFQVAPLALPEFADIVAGEALRADAVALLASRLEAVDTRFHLGDADVPVVVAICRRLDGLPLALELVAARARTLPLSAILEALEQHLPLLTGGERDRPARQRTMTDALAWSYALLDAPAAALFRRLGVCLGGATMETAAALADDLGLSDVGLLDVLDDLVAHSLVHRVDASDSRYRMLEVIREFALDELIGAGEADSVRRRHAHHFLAVAEAAAAKLHGPDQVLLLDRLQRDAANLNAALRWTIAEGNADMALRLCLSLRLLWYVRGSIAEGLSLFGAALQVPGASPRLRARALVEASTLARHHGDFEAARALVDEGLAIARSGADADLLASALLHQGFVLHLLGRYDEARAALEESLALCHAADDALGIARASHHLGLIAYFGDGDTSLAWEMQCRCLALYRRLRNQRHAATALIAMVELARARGDRAAARDLLTEAVSEVSRLDDVPLLVYALHHAAGLAADEAHPSRAVRLLGAAQGLERASGAAPWPAVAAGQERWLPRVERRLGARRVAALLEAGRRMSAADAVALATASDDDRDPLTAREHEIAALVADGLTNRAIAERLVVSERTVDGHVARILRKLGFSSRAQIAAWVVGNEQRTIA